MPTNMKVNYDGYSERRHEIGPIMYPMHIDRDRHHRFYSATQSRMEDSDPLANTFGRTCIIDGDLFYSPNGRRPLTRIPPTAHGHIQLDSRHDSVNVVREPMWWSMEYAHLAFLEVNSMQTGAFGWALHTPEYHWRKKDKTFSMRTVDIIRWHRLERDLKLFMTSLSELGNVPPTPNIIDRVFTCGGIYDSNERLKQDIIHCREWYSYWTCRLAYAIAACESIKHDRDNSHRATVSFEWLQSMVQQDWYEGFIASVNATCGVFDGSVERVGVIMDIVEPKPRQFSVEWLVHYGVPVWYRWGQREIDTSETNNDLKRLAPRAESVQQGSTFMTKTPTQPNAVDPRAVLNAFIAEREKRTKEIEEKETDDNRRRRKQRDDAGGLKRVKVFVWEKDDGGVYKRRVVTQADKEDTLNFYGKEQRFYSSVFGEWDCCSALGDKTQEECEEEDMLNELEYGDEGGDYWVEHERQHYPSYQDQWEDDSRVTYELSQERHSVPDVASNPSRDPENPGNGEAPQTSRLKGYATIHGQQRLLTEDDMLTTEVEIFEAIHIMHEYIGYVAPIGDVSRQEICPKMNDTSKIMYTNLLGKDKPDHQFFESHVSAPALSFLDKLCSADNKPSEELWDLCKQCRYPLAGARRIKHIKKLKANDSTIFVLDMGDLSTVEWSLGVTTAATALMICRWDRDMSDYEICRQLLQRGIHFKVLVPLRGRVLCSSNVPRRPRTPIRTAGYVFTRDDYVSYCSDKHAMLSDDELAKRALKTGGIVWRLSVECSFDTVLSGGQQYTQSADVYSDPEGTRYFDEKCNEEEIEAICGAYKCAQADKPKIQIKSWWPTDKTWKSNVAYPFWTEYVEAWFTKRLKSIQAGEGKPMTQHQWRSLIRKNGKLNRLHKALETHSANFLGQSSTGGL